MNLLLPRFHCDVERLARVKPATRTFDSFNSPLGLSQHLSEGLTLCWNGQPDDIKVSPNGEADGVS